VVSLRKRAEPTVAPPWLWQDAWVAMITAYSQLRVREEPELLRSMRVCESAIREVANAESTEAAESASVTTLGTRSGPVLVRAIRAGQPDIVRAKLLEDFHRTVWPQAVDQSRGELAGAATLDDALDDDGRAELEALCFATLRRYASDETWEVVVENAAYDRDAHPNPRFAEVLRVRL
jgi:hypothetical protein